MNDETIKDKDSGPAHDVSVCGTDCAACRCRGTLCKGCSACGGKVFHAGGGVCPIYSCVKERRGLSDCGRCGQLPCGIWRSTRDPAFTDAEFERSIAERIKTLSDIRRTEGAEHGGR